MERLADALPLDRAASRWIVSSDPEEQVEQNPPLCRTRLPSPGLPCPRPRPGPLSCSSTPKRCCHCCARSSADDGETGLRWLGRRLSSATSQQEPSS